MFTKKFMHNLTMYTDPLPEYEIDPQDELIVFHLLDDETFKESIESEFGKLQKMYPDWRTDQLVYEFLDGSAKYSILSEIVKALKDMGYLNTFMH
jgi:hypothetical protein